MNLEDPFMSLEDPFMSLKTLADHLVAIGEGVTNCDLILYAISDLDSNNHPFMPSFTM